MHRELHEIIIRLSDAGHTDSAIASALALKGLRQHAVQRWRKMPLGEYTREEPYDGTFRRRGQVDYAAMMGAPKDDRPPEPDEPEKTATWTERSGEAYLERMVTEPIKSLDDLIRVCEIDTDTWDVDRWTCAAYTTTLKMKAGEGDAARQVQGYSVKAWLKKKVREIVLRAVASEIIADIRQAAPVYIAQRYDSGDHMLLLSFPDVHFGKGESIDDELALHARAVEDLLSKASGFRIGQICVVSGNDATQIDSSAGTTTRGTHVEHYASWQRQFRAAVRAYRYKIERCLELAPVHVVNVPGNHDTHTAFGVGEVLDAVFSQARHVTVDNSPPLRKYHRYGVSLLGFSHGHNEKKNDLPLIMAQEQPEAWSATTWREWHLGHKHHKSATTFGGYQELQGVLVRVSSALCGPDAWHTDKGYIGAVRGAEAHVYAEAGGHTGSFTFNVT
jgi:hypothetical protein